MSTSLSVISCDLSLQRYLREINAVKSLSQEEEFMLAKSYLEHNDIKAAHQLIASHLKLVAKIAISYRNYGLQIADLISEGNIGLMHAVKKYQPSLGFRLSTYAMWWIKAYINDYILRSWSLVKIGTSSMQKKLFFNLNKIKRRILSSDNLLSGDYATIAQEVGASEQDVMEMASRLSNPDSSLNAQIVGKNGGSVEAIDMLADPRPTCEVSLIKAQDVSNRAQLLNDAMATLSPRERVIMSKRKLSSPVATLEELSIEFGISKERVRQIADRAFEKVKQYVLARYQR